jgi:hypothetical protein
MSVDLSSLGQIKFKGSNNHTLSLSAPNVSADSSLGIGGEIVEPTNIAAAVTLTSANSGKVFMVSEVGADYTITLPTVSAGLRYKFFLDATTGAKSITVSAPKANSIFGTYTSGGGAVTAGRIDAKTSIIFSKTAVVGDYIELVGLSANKWSAVAVSAVKDAITF